MVIDDLIEVLSTFNKPVYREGAMRENDPYPDDFFTFWLVDNWDHKHYDDTNFLEGFEFDVCYFSTDPELAYTTVNEAIRRLKANGFTASGSGFDAYSESRDHVGVTFKVFALQPHEAAAETE